MIILVIDSDVLNLVQPGAPLHYLAIYPRVKLVPSRRAREQGEASSNQFITPFPEAEDAPVALITSHPGRRLSDPASILAPSRGMQEIPHMRNGAWSGGSDKHFADQEVLASAIDLYERARRDDSQVEVYFLTGDRTFCKKATAHLGDRNIPIKVLFARKEGKKLPSAREVVEEFPP